MTQFISQSNRGWSAFNLRANLISICNIFIVDDATMASCIFVDNCAGCVSLYSVLVNVLSHCAESESTYEEKQWVCLASILSIDTLTRTHQYGGGNAVNAMTTLPTAYNIERYRITLQKWETCTLYTYCIDVILFSIMRLLNLDACLNKTSGLA